MGMLGNIDGGRGVNKVLQRYYNQHFSLSLLFFIYITQTSVCIRLQRYFPSY